MIDTYLLEQLVAVYENGTLSSAAEKLNLTQPSLTRSMQKIESLLGVQLFDRHKNRVTLNSNGIFAAEQAKHLIAEEQNMIDRIRAYDRSSRMITVGSVAPGPLFELPALLSSAYPEKTISTELRNEDELIQGLFSNNYQMIILNREIVSPQFFCVPCGQEQLYFSVPYGHRIAEMKDCSFSDMNGESFLMVSEVGNWDKVVREHMPDSRFIIQRDLEALSEIINSSTLAAFATDITIRVLNRSSDRVMIPISDAAAHERFYCCCKTSDMNKYKTWFQLLKNRISTDFGY